MDCNGKVIYVSKECDVFYSANVTFICNVIHLHAVQYLYIYLGFFYRYISECIINQRRDEW
jgi:hypothetical protein